jgi:hypothetical protein
MFNSESPTVFLNRAIALRIRYPGWGFGASDMSIWSGPGADKLDNRQRSFP